MRRFLLAVVVFAACWLLPDQAFAQCNGIFPASTVCGNSTAVNSTPFPITMQIPPNLASYGIVGNGVHDDAPGIQALCADITAGKYHFLSWTPGATFNIWNNTPAQQSVACALSGVSGLRVDYNGATFNVPYLGNAITYIYTFIDSTNIEINDLKGTAAGGRHVSGDITGTNWVSLTNQGGVTDFGCQNCAVRRPNINGGLDGVAVVRGLGTGQWSYNITVDNGVFVNVGYPFSTQADGLNSTAKYVAVNAGRAYVGYNVWGVDLTIDSTTGNALNDIATGNVAFQGDLSGNAMKDLRLSYVNRNSTVYGASLISVTFDQGDPVHGSLPSVLSDFNIRLDVSFNSTPSTTITNMQTFSGTSGAKVPGDVAGNRLDNFRLTGTVEGNTTSSMGCFLSVLSNCQGFSGLTKASVFVSMQMPNATTPWFIGQGAAVTFQDYSSPSANFPTFEGGYAFSQLSVRNAIFANTGGFPITGTMFCRDATGQNTCLHVLHGAGVFFETAADVQVGAIGTASGSFDLTSTSTVPLRLGYNSTLYWNVGPSGILQPITDSASAIGDNTHRASNVFSVIGTFNSVVIPGSGSGNVTQVAQAAAGTPTITWGTNSGTPAVTVSAPLVLTTATGNLTCPTCVTSAASLTLNQLVIGSGSQGEQTLGTLGTTTTVLHGNAGGAPTFAAVVSADLNITTTTCTNQFITAISSGGVGTCTTDTLASAQHANQGTTTTVLHGNAAGNPSWAAVSLTADVSGILPLANGGTNNNLTATSGGVVWSDASKLNISALLGANCIVYGGGAGTAPATSSSTCPTVSSAGVVTVANTTDAASTVTGALIVSGGLGVAKQIYGLGANFTNGSAAAPVLTVSASASNFSGNYIGLSLSATNTATSAATFLGHNFQNFITFNTGSTGAAYDGVVYQLVVGVQNSVTPTIAANLVTAAAIFGASPTGTVTSWYQYWGQAIASQASGTPAMTISNYYGIRLENAAANSVSGLTLTTVYGLYVAGQVAGTTGYGIYLDTGNTTSALFIADTKDATSVSTGSLHSAGGMSVNKRVWFNGLSAASAGLSAACVENTGEITTNTGVTTCLISGRQWKHNIDDMPDFHASLMALKPRAFRWNDNNRSDIGMIADEVEQASPFFVGLRNGIAATWRSENVTTALVQGYQRHERDIVRLMADNDNLHTEMAKLKRANAR